MGLNHFVQRKIIFAVIAIAIIAVGTFAGLYLSNNITLGNTTRSSPNSDSKIQVVAAENFWGSLISQLGGTHTNVLSIVSDPNADPHEYESNSADARAIADANLVIVNGVGYDDWALQLIAASSIPHQVVLNVQELVNQPVGANPHFWYSPYYVNDTVKAMYKDLVSIDPTNTAYYKQQYVALNASLGVYNALIDEIKQKFGGTKVASTESIFEYLANATGLNLVSPPAFMEDVSEGIEPTAAELCAVRAAYSEWNCYRVGLQQPNGDAAHDEHRGTSLSTRHPDRWSHGDHPAAERPVPRLDELAVNRSSERT